MSLILDALRKSEAERRRGQVPDLHAEPAPIVQPARDGPPAWLWMALAFTAAVVLAFALWLARGMMAATPGAMPEPDVLVRVGTTAESPADSALAQATVPTAESTSAVTAPPEPHANAPEPVRASPRPTAESALLDPPPPESEPPPVARRPDATTAEHVAPVPQPASPPADEAAGIAASTPEQPATEASTATPREPPTTMARHGPTLLSELSVAERERLPPLRMSMHLWAPTQRFAIIDGARVSEGDRVGDAVVEEITPDGVYLAWQGYRLLVPVR